MSLLSPPDSNAFALKLPIQCTLGETCFIQNYVDLDPKEGWKDYQCGHLSYDGHKGTDFRLKNMAAMRAGVKVIAAADGKVVNTRDGMKDVNFNDLPMGAVQDRECGNGVLLEHTQGFKTQYCHMKNGSIRVKRGQSVKAGEALGEVGLSGMSEFPHVHLQLTDAEGTILDPFSGPMLSSKCGGFSTHYWHASVRESLRYIDSALLGGGFAGFVPDATKLRDDPAAAAQVDKASDVIALWADVMGPRAGDMLYLTLLNPNGRTLAQHSQKVEKNQAQLFRFVGKKRQGARWPDGTYRGTITLKRGEDIDAKTVFNHKFEVAIGDPAHDRIDPDAARDNATPQETEDTRPEGMKWMHSPAQDEQKFDE